MGASLDLVVELITVGLERSNTRICPSPAHVAKVLEELDKN